jgi:hypothetical protein
MRTTFGMTRVSGVEGAYSLKLAGGSAKAPEGYHYDADGSLHKNH